MSAVMVTPSFWDRVTPTTPDPAWMADIVRLTAEAEARRHRATYDTGSITVVEAYLLRSLAEWVEARVVIEVGTFIGTSTQALASASTVTAVYTCDASNDCLDSDHVVRTFPFRTSTAMLRSLVAHDVCADLCFLDGVLAEADLDALEAVCRPAVVFALHDYTHGPKRRVRHGVVTYETVPRKGIGNARRLEPRWPTHVLVDPLPDTTLALLVPEGA